MAGEKKRSVRVTRERVGRTCTLVGEWFSGASVPMAVVVRRQWRKKGAESMGDARGEAGRCDDDCSCSGGRGRGDGWTGSSPFLYVYTPTYCRAEMEGSVVSAPVNAGGSWPPVTPASAATVVEGEPARVWLSAFGQVRVLGVHERGRVLGLHAWTLNLTLHRFLAARFVCLAVNAWASVLVQQIDTRWCMGIQLSASLN
jgi:hypothetical protein